MRRHSKSMTEPERDAAFRRNRIARHAAKPIRLRDHREDEPRLEQREMRTDAVVRAGAEGHEGARWSAGGGPFLEAGWPELVGIRPERRVSVQRVRAHHDGRARRN